MSIHSAEDEAAVRDVFAAFHQLWNKREAAAIAGLFAEGGSIVGFDGSMVDGRQAIGAHLGEIFMHHQTAAYVGIVREARFPAAEVAVLRAVAGMVPPDGSDINPAVNTVQTMVALRRDDRWRIELLQSTPAAFHGRPEAVEELTAELRTALQVRSR